MKDGKDDFENALTQAENLAAKYELQLPHVADTIYQLTKLIRVFDKNVSKMAKLYTKQARNIRTLNEVVNYSRKFLTGAQMNKINRHIRKWQKKHK